MKFIENGLDLGLGLIILTLTVSTSLLGLKHYLHQDLYKGLPDKNTVDVEGSVLPSDNILSKDILELSLTLTASIINTDNTRQINITIKAKNDNSDVALIENKSLTQPFKDTKELLENAIKEYCETSSHRDNLINGKYQSFVTADQSSITCYILVE